MPKLGMVMRAAVVCPGPSMPTAAPGPWEGRASLVIAVNRAATVHRCDVWAALDHTTVASVGSKVVGSPAWLGDDDQAYKLSTTDGVMGWSGAARVRLEEVAEWMRVLGGDGGESVGEEFGQGGWRLYSTTAAIATAAVLVTIGGVVELWGADMAGAKDWDGREGGNRDELRWQRERAIVGALSMWMRARGLKLEVCR